MVRASSRRWLGIALRAAVLSLAFAGVAPAQGPPQPSKTDKCPVCGMFVSKYPDWLATAVYADGSAEFFDGPKDLLRYYLNVKKYDPRRSPRDVAALLVTEYYDVVRIDSKKALFVVGSDVYGPMGHELIPLASEGDARTFLEDHKGKKVLRFDEITQSVLDALD